MPKGTSQNAGTGQQLASEEPLPVAIKTITINGKRLTPQIFKQIPDENPLDEDTAELRGDPIGLINIHRKDCPPYWHLHVLWNRKGALQQGMICLPTDNAHYQELEKRYTKRCAILLDLIALLESQHSRLCLSYASDDVTIGAGTENETDDDYFQYQLEEQHDLDLMIGNFNIEGLSRDAFLAITQLEEAQRCLELELEKRGNPGTQATKAKGKKAQQHAEPDPASEAAREVLEALSKRSIVVAHPSLRRHYSNMDLRAGYTLLNQRENGYNTTLPDRVMGTDYDRWFVHTSAPDRDLIENWQIVWSRDTPGMWDKFSLADVHSIEDQLKPHTQALRVLLAEEAITRDRNIISHEIFSRYDRLDPLPQNTMRVPRSAEIASDMLEQEHEQFRAFTARWQQQVAALHTLDQIYITA